MDFTLQAILNRVLAGASKDIKTVTYVLRSVMLGYIWANSSVMTELVGHQTIGSVGPFNTEMRGVFWQP